MKAIKLFLSVILATVLSGCATIIQTNMQDVGFSSSPSNAIVTVDDTELGNTPVTAKLRRKENHLVKIELDGYMPYEVTLTRTVSGWVWGNLVFG